jgi:hypothetical protein
MRKFRFAGVSKVDGRIALRASNRDAYADILKRDKNTAINIIKLDKPMTKDQIREHLARRKAFQSPAILSVLKRGDVEPVAKKKAPAKRTASRKAPTVQATSAAA